MDGVILAWRDIDLTAVQREWAKDSERINKNRIESQRSLSELKKTSRSLAIEIPQELRQKIAPLVKRYQAEIEALKSRSEFVETCSMKLFVKLTGAPDPSIELANQREEVKQAAAVLGVGHRSTSIRPARVFVSQLRSQQDRQFRPTR